MKKGITWLSMGAVVIFAMWMTKDWRMIWFMSFALLAD